MILVAGASGFIGKNLISYFARNNIIYSTLKKNEVNNFESIISSNVHFDVLINLIGKAHDLKNVTNSSEYYEVNTEISKKIFDSFVNSDIKVFITISSVKAITDEVVGDLFEDFEPQPITHYGKSKLLSEQYILSKLLPAGKRVYILRPCMVHGPGNKGNLNLLFSLISKGFPWPLGQFENSRSYLSIENLCFIIKELVERDDIPSGVYNVADDLPLSTNEIINLIAEVQGVKPKYLNINKSLIKFLARFGDFLKLPLNSERLQKLTESYVVSNVKIKTAIGKPLPISSKLGLLKTFQSFFSNA